GATEREVLGDGGVEHEASAQAVLGEVSEPAGEARPRRGARDVAFADPDRAARDGEEARDHARELALAVAVDPRDADDLAGAHVKCRDLERPHRDIAQLERARRALSWLHDDAGRGQLRADHRASDRADVERAALR